MRETEKKVDIDVLHRHRVDAEVDATFALIIATGAMLAAIAAGLVAFEALQH